MTLEKVAKEFQDRNIEIIKLDLEWQLSFENIDWEYFIEIANKAKAAQDKINTIKEFS